MPLVDRLGAGSFVHTGLQNGVRYYYSAFFYDEVPNYTAAVQRSVTPQDSVPPGVVVGLGAQAGVGQVTLNWTNPSTDDLVGVMVRYTTGDGSPPVTITQGSLAARVEGDPKAPMQFVHPGLTSGTQYNYSVFAYDEVPNYSGPQPVTVSATPVDQHPPGPGTFWGAEPSDGIIFFPVTSTSKTTSLDNPSGHPGTLLTSSGAP